MTPRETSPVLLTLAIPTYQRVDCLKLLFDVVLPEIDAINQSGTRVEVLVCDNASADGTGPYLEGLAARTRLRVIRHAANIGADANVIHCFEQARGRYVWIFGDDDLPLQGTFGKVIDVLEREAPALLYLPARWQAGSLAAHAKEAAAAGAPVPVAAMALALEANAYLTFISSWVVDREAYLASAAPPGARRHAGTSLPQLEWHLELLVSGRKLMLAPGHHVLATAAGTGGYSLFEVFITNFARIIGDKLRAHANVQTFLRDFMLRSYLPGLVWGLRNGAVGNFGKLDADAIGRRMRDAWPMQRLARAVLRLIVVLPRPLAKAVYAATWVYARAWLIGMRSQAKGRNK